MLNPWRSELSLVAFTLLLGLFVGQLIHQTSWVLWIALVAYLAHHLFHIHRLLEWLRSGRAAALPEGLGIWEEVYYLIFKLRKRNRRRKKQLIRMLDRFRTATAALPDATVVLNPHDQIDWFNEAAGKLLGLRRSDVGQNIANLIRIPKFIHFLSQPDEQGTLKIPSPLSGDLQLEVRVVPYSDDLRLLVAQDVTRIRFMERVRTDFVANVSHELRTPLTVIRGYVETLVDNADPLPASQIKIFNRMEEQALRMQKLLDELLCLTRLESSSQTIAQKVVNVPELLHSICEEHWGRSAQGGPELALEIETDAGLRGGEQELRSAFTNLIANAMKYCASGDRVRVRWLLTEKGLQMEVADTGPGIEPEYLPRLTERFYRVNEARGPDGFGLGLAIVKHVMVRHGGELKIQSTPGQGSHFFCCFPSNRTLLPQEGVVTGVAPLPTPIGPDPTQK